MVWNIFTIDENIFRHFSLSKMKRLIVGVKFFKYFSNCFSCSCFFFSFVKVFDLRDDEFCFVLHIYRVIRPRRINSQKHFCVALMSAMALCASANSSANSLEWSSCNFGYLFQYLFFIPTKSIVDIIVHFSFVRNIAFHSLIPGSSPTLKKFFNVSFTKSMLFVSLLFINIHPKSHGFLVSC